MRTALIFAACIAGMLAVVGVTVGIAEGCHRISKWLELKGVRYTVAYMVPFTTFIVLLYAGLFTWLIASVKK